MEIIQQLVPVSQYPTKCPYGMTPKGVCIHNTANRASAQAERNNVAKPENTSEVSFHIAVDDKEAIQLIPFNRNAWASGDGSTGEGNRNYIHIEICYSLDGGDKFIQAEKNCAIIVAQLIKQYGWTMANVKKHQDFSGKNCPHRTLSMGWDRFLNMIKAELQQPTTQEMYRVRKSWDNPSSQIGAFGDLENAKKLADSNKGYYVFNNSGTAIYPVATKPPVVTPPVTPQPPQTGEYTIKDYAESGVFTCTVDSIYFRNKPLVASSNPTQGQYFYGETVIYDRVVITNKYVYISWISRSGIRRYMPYWDKVNDPKGNDRWGTIK